MQNILKDTEDRMDKAVEALKKDFGRLRTGRASASLVDEIVVDYYGTPTPIPQLASVTAESTTITIKPWDKSVMGAVDKALQNSDLGINPVNDGEALRINMPPLTEDRRKELVKMAKKYTEDAKVAVRNVRRDANDQLKKLEKDKEITEDDLRKGQEDIQKITDASVAKCDTALSDKEKEIMEI